MLTSNTILMPASYNGVPFRVEVDSKASGRRIVVHEFPKKNIPYSEDMGRRVRRWPVTGYIIYSPVNDPDWQANRDDLIAELEAEGPGLLVLPTGLQNMSDEPPGMVVVDTYVVTEHRERGGYCEFDMTFIEAGQNSYSPASNANTQAAVNTAAGNAAANTTSSSDMADYENPSGPSSSPMSPSITPVSGDNPSPADIPT